MKLRIHRPRFLLSLSALIALLVAGCKILPDPVSDSTRYFVLASTPAEIVAQRGAGPLQVGLRSIELPGYLRNHRDMVVRKGLNEIRFDGYSRWAEALEVGLQRILKERIGTADTVGAVLTQPFSGDVRRDYDVTIRIVRCEGAVNADKSATARLVAYYEIVQVAGAGNVLVRRTFSAPEQPWDGSDFGALARLLGEGAELLAADIVANLPK